MTAGNGKGWAGRRTVVTGATGFIGAHLVRRLGSLGAEVHAVSRTRRASDDATIWHAVDLRDGEATGRLIRATRPDVVFHLASEVTGTRDVHAVRPTLEANLSSVINLLTAAMDAAGGATARVVLAGSIEEPRPEKGETTSSSPYAVAKWAATGYARLFHQLWRVPVTVLRVAMVYGPGDPNTRRLVPYVTRSLLEGRPPEISSGTRLVDWVYVDDVVDAFIAAAEAESAGGVFDVGTGTGTSIGQVVERLVEISGVPVEPRYGALADRPLDAARIADIAPAADTLGWHPAVGLDEGLRRTFRWYAHDGAGVVPPR
ncbi:NAD-dependent epimerase/dehydratase family protein [Sphaerimonospora sp. CA-214678]|uniref:NAD-dependent epimerase/dehydratase family protein n=1 Tax=Sphaerimonospora sp. CA-214678 TaxID=3240029 RepID=UPI003D8C6EE5